MMGMLARCIMHMQPRKAMKCKSGHASTPTTTISSTSQSCLCACALEPPLIQRNSSGEQCFSFVFCGALEQASRWSKLNAAKECMACCILCLVWSLCPSDEHAMYRHTLLNPPMPDRVEATPTIPHHNLACCQVLQVKAPSGGCVCHILGILTQEQTTRQSAWKRPWFKTLGILTQEQTPRTSAWKKLWFCPCLRELLSGKDHAVIFLADHRLLLQDGSGLWSDLLEE